MIGTWFAAACSCGRARRASGRAQARGQRRCIQVVERRCAARAGTVIDSGGTGWPPSRLASGQRRDCLRLHRSIGSCRVPATAEEQADRRTTSGRRSRQIPQRAWLSQRGSRSTECRSFEVVRFEPDAPKPGAFRLAIGPRAAQPDHRYESRKTALRATRAHVIDPFPTDTRAAGRVSRSAGRRYPSNVGAGRR